MHFGPSNKKSITLWFYEPPVQGSDDDKMEIVRKEKSVTLVEEKCPRVCN